VGCNGDAIAESGIAQCSHDVDVTVPASRPSALCTWASGLHVLAPRTGPSLASRPPVAVVSDGAPRARLASLPGISSGTVLPCTCGDAKQNVERGATPSAGRKTRSCLQGPLVFSFASLAPGSGLPAPSTGERPLEHWADLGRVVARRLASRCAGEILSDHLSPGQRGPAPTLRVVGPDREHYQIPWTSIYLLPDPPPAAHIVPLPETSTSTLST